MSGELVVLRKQLEPLLPRLEMALAGRVDPQRLVQTVLMAVERTPKLLECDRQSVFNAALSAAVLGLEVDSVTGQAFLIPFKGKAQLVIGYRGFSTLAARSGYAIRGAVVREGDDFDYNIAAGVVRHRPKLGDDGRIIGAWALAASNSLPSIASVLSIDELMAVKAKSPGAQQRDSPWNDPKIGFPAMCEKTAKRRLARCMPLNVMQLASAMDEAVEERGKYSWITPEEGVRIEGGEVISPTIRTQPVIDLSAKEFAALPPELSSRAAALRDYLNASDSTVTLNARWAGKKAVALRDQIRMVSAEANDALTDVYDKRHTALTELEESSQSDE